MLKTIHRSKLSLFTHAVALSVALTAGLAVAGASDAEASDCPSSCSRGCTAVSPYPFVFVHGMLGGSSSFNTVRSELEANYAAECKTIATYAVDVSKVNGPDVRGADLANELTLVLADSGASKVHLVGHSLGSRDVRYFAKTMGGKVPGYGSTNRVASVTTVAGDGAAAPLANLASNVYGFAPAFWTMAQDAVGAMASLVANYSETDTDFIAAMDSLDTEGSRAFECGNPNASGVRYGRHGGRIRHVATLAPAQLAVAPTWALMEALGDENDGIVTVKMARGNGVAADWELHAGAFYSIGVNHFALIDVGEVWGFESDRMFKKIVEFAVGNRAGSPPSQTVALNCPQ